MYPLSSGWSAVIAPRLSAVLVFGLPLYVACGGSNLTLPGEGEPAHIAMFAGNGQSARVGSQLSPLVARVTDSKDRPVAGVTVEFVFDNATGGSTIAPSSVTTGADGKAVATITLGDQVGAVTGQAKVTVPQSTTPIQIAFTATALPADASAIQAVSGDGQTGQVGSALGQPLVVKVADQFGNPIPGVTVSWSITGGGSVSESSTQTGQDGLTSVTRVLGGAAGPQTTKATAEALTGSPSVTFTHTATAGSASRVEKLAGDAQSAQAGTELPIALVVQVLDAQGNPVVGRAVTWVIGAGGGSVAPQNTPTDAQGKASTRWTLGSSVGNNTVNAVVSGVGTATFSATATAGSVSASRSQVTASPGTITAGAGSSTITVQVKDANGTAVSGVAVSVSSSGAGNQIDPASATSNENGVATFTFSSTVGGEDKTITAAAGGVTLDQRPTITVKKAESRTRINSHDPNPSTAGQQIPVTFTVTSLSGGGTPSGQVTVVSNKESTPASTCTATLDAAGQGTCNITLTVVGIHRLIALYGGDGRFDVSNDDDPHQVDPAFNPPPTASFTHADCTAGTECQFNDTSTDNTAVVAWHWDFGDVASPNNTSDLRNPTHSFTLGGGTTYTVSLTVTDDQGATNTTSQTVAAH
jgi:adhesin/invasin